MSPQDVLLDFMKGLDPYNLSALIVITFALIILVGSLLHYFIEEWELRKLNRKDKS